MSSSLPTPGASPTPHRHGLYIGARTLWGMFGSAVVLVGVLASYLYNGLSDDIRAVRDDLRSVQQNLAAATVAGEQVKDAVSRGTDLEKQFRETHDTVIQNRERLDTALAQLSSIDGKLDGLAARTEAVRSDTDRILGALAATGKVPPKRE